MTERKIKLTSIDEAKLLVNQAMSCDFDIDLIAGRYVVDAKSIMGIFSVVPSDSLVLRADCGDDDPFWGKIKSLIVG